MNDVEKAKVKVTTVIAAAVIVLSAVITFVYTESQWRVNTTRDILQLKKEILALRLDLQNAANDRFYRREMRGFARELGSLNEGIIRVPEID